MQLGRRPAPINFGSVANPKQGWESNRSFVTRSCGEQVKLFGER
jgi:hypothetical protein